MPSKCLCYVKSLNKVLSNQVATVKDILAKYPNGVYTSCRTFNNKILMLSTHLDRIRNGATELDLDYNHDHLTIIKDMLKQHMGPNQRITIIYHKEAIHTISASLITPPQSVAVSIQEATRDNPSVKSIEWAQKRQALESLIQDDVNEVIIHQNGYCYEGLSSNFFIYRHGQLETAPSDQVLPGTIQDLIAKQHKIHYRFPDTREIDTWQGAFITSTSRLLLPIHRIEWQGTTYTMDPHLFESHQASLASTLDAYSESL